MKVGDTARNNKLKLGEKLADNLTGKQIYNILFKFLHRGLDPVLDYSQLGRIAAAELWSRILNDKRRRISYLDDTEYLQTMLYNVIMTEHPSRYWKAAKIERVYGYRLLSFFLDYFQYEPKRRHYNKPAPWGIDGIYLIPMYENAKQYFGIYTNFKNMIVEKYTKYAYGLSSRKAGMTGLFVDRHDLWQDMMLAVENAINKFQPEKGTLTSVIKSWLTNAEKSKGVSHTYGESYSVDFRERSKLKNDLASGKSNASNFALPIEEAAEIVANETMFSWDLNPNKDIIKYAKRFQGGRWFLLKHGVPFTLDDNEQEKFIQQQYQEEEMV